LSFHGVIPIAILALCHSCHPSPLFLVHVVVFYKMVYVSLMEIKVKLTQTLKSFVSCW
jgi:hypothetical protein